MEFGASDVFRENNTDKLTNFNIENRVVYKLFY